MKGIANGFCLLVICSTLLIACSSPAPSLPRSYLLSPSAPQEAKEISRPVWLVADNQIHNLYGEPIPLLRTGLADRLVEWAIRSVQLDFYGEYLLRWFLERRASAEPVHPVIHLGDASDISCTGEFERFLEIMRLAKGGWVMAPGNHDGFFYGDEQADLEGDSDWTDGCKNAARCGPARPSRAGATGGLTLKKAPDGPILFSVPLPGISTKDTLGDLFWSRSWISRLPTSL
jgi:hypothetical protein